MTMATMPMYVRTPAQVTAGFGVDRYRVVAGPCRGAAVVPAVVEAISDLPLLLRLLGRRSRSRPGTFTNTNATRKMKRNVIVDSAAALLKPARICLTTRIDRVVVAFPLPPPPW